MTALIALERADLTERMCTSSYRPAAAESVVGLLPGERMRVRDLLRGLLLASGNDAAMALASGVAGSERAFVRLMNRRAKQLELRDTHYENPIGLDAPGNHSSARDLVRLALVLRTHRFFRATVDAPQLTLRSGAHARTVRNRNTLVRRYPWVNGVKTGQTRQAGYVLVGSGRRHGVQVISAVLGTASEAARDAQSVLLLATGIRAFQNITAARVGSRVKGLARIPIRYRPGAGLPLVIGPNRVRVIVPRGQRRIVTVRPLSAPSEVEGPIRRGQGPGAGEVLRDGRRIATVPLVAAAPVPEATLGQRLKAWFARPGAVVLAFAVLGGTVLLARARRSGRARPGSRREPSAA